MLHEPLKDRAQGRWHTILPAIGVSSKMLVNRHGPCPLCGGKDRFRFDDKGGRGTWICNQCGAGDGIELVKRFRGVDFKAAAEMIETHVGGAPVLGGRDRRPSADSRQRDEMNALWNRARPITMDDLAGQYLHARTGLTTFPMMLRFSPDERYTEAGRRPSWHPAMIAKVYPSDAALEAGQRPALHRTYLSPFATKAEVGSPRKMMGTMPTGAAVRLMRPVDGVLGIAEGIETALAASVLFEVPTWAALTAGLLQEWVPPAGLKMVFVFGDNDRSNTGQAAAYGLAARLKARGLEAVVQMPPVPGQDWNDVLTSKLEAA